MRKDLWVTQQIFDYCKYIIQHIFTYLICQNTKQKSMEVSLLSNLDFLLISKRKV